MFKLLTLGRFHSSQPLLLLPNLKLEEQNLKKNKILKIVGQRNGESIFSKGDTFEFSF